MKYNEHKIIRVSKTQYNLKVRFLFLSCFYLYLYVGMFGIFGRFIAKCIVVLWSLDNTKLKRPGNIINIYFVVSGKIFFLSSPM